MLIKFLKPDFEFSDSRGQLIQLVHSGWNQVNYIISYNNTLRGNHYHKINTEAFFVIQGEFYLSLRSLLTDEQDKLLISSGAFFIIPPHIVHSFFYIKNTNIISMYNIGVENSDGSKDIYSCE